jgi:hypothetical protein
MAIVGLFVALAAEAVFTGDELICFFLTTITKFP